MNTDIDKKEEAAVDDRHFCAVEDIRDFLEQVNIALLSIVNSINTSMSELNKRSETSDDNED